MTEKILPVHRVHARGPQPVGCEFLICSKLQSLTLLMDAFEGYSTGNGINAHEYSGPTGDLHVARRLVQLAPPPLVTRLLVTDQL